MPGIMDLSAEDRARFNEITKIIKSRKSAVNSFDQEALLLMWPKLNAEELRFTIFQCMANDWLNYPRWEHLGELVKEFGIERTRWALKRMVGLENYSLDTVEDLLRADRTARRTKPGSTTDAADNVDPRVKQAQQRQLLYPTKEGVHTERTATAWLREVKQVGVEHWPEFFDACGIDEVIKTMKLYQLKAEYR